MSGVVILMYHMVSKALTPKDRRYACDQKLFRSHLKYLTAQHFNIISLDQFLKLRAEANSIPQNTVLITFDDGFSDNYENAFPVLQEAGAPATIFLASGVVGRSNKWMHGQGFSERRMLKWGQIEEMSRDGITFGSHTVSHPRLVELSEEAVNKEVRDSKLAIEDRLGISVDHFAYPYGLENSQVQESVKRAGYQSACSTRSGFNTKSTDPFVLRRIEICGTDSLRQFKQKITFGTNDSSLTFPLKYYTRRLRERL